MKTYVKSFGIGILKGSVISEITLPFVLIIITLKRIISEKIIINLNWMCRYLFRKKLHLLPLLYCKTCPLEFSSDPINFFYPCEKLEKVTELLSYYNGLVVSLGYQGKPWPYI